MTTLTISNSSNEEKITLTAADHFFGRIYYCVCSAIDLAKTVSKFVLALFSSTISAMFCGKSKLFNELQAYAWKDCGFSAKMFLFSLQGIIDPVSAYISKAALHKENLTDYSLNDKEIKEITLLEQIPARLIAIVATIAELMGTAFAMIRFAFAMTMYAISCGFAQGIGVIALGAGGSLIRSIGVSSLCFIAIFNPNIFLNKEPN